MVSQISHLQVAQNAAARFLKGCKKFDHVTPILRSLHWLPVQYRIEYKILLIVTYLILAFNMQFYLVFIFYWLVILCLFFLCICIVIIVQPFGRPAAVSKCALEINET